MAINPESQYPGKITPSTPSYPYGSARNVTVPGDGTGTPWEAALVNDFFGFQQALLARANIVPSGTPDNATASQYLDALLDVVGTRSYTTRATMIADITLADGQRVFTFQDSRFEAWSIQAGSGDILLDNGLYAVKSLFVFQTFETVADLKANNYLLPGMSVKTKGYTTAGDGGHAEYLIQSPASVDEQSDHTLTNGNVAILQVDRELKAVQFGAVSGQDATDAFKAMSDKIVDNTILDFGSAEYEISASGVPADPYGHRIFDISDKVNIRFKGDRCKIIVNNHNAGSDGGLMFIWGRAVRGLHVSGFDFDMSFVGVHTGSTQYPFLGAVIGQEESNAVAGGPRTQDQLNGDWIVEKCSFKLFHPFGQFAQSGSSFGGDPNNGFKVFPFSFFGPFDADQYENQCRNVLIKDNVLKEGGNSYGFWTWATNHITVESNVAEAFIGKQSNAVGVYSGRGEPMIRYHQFYCTGVKVSSNTFRALPSEDRLTAGFEGGADFFHYNTNLNGDFAHGACSVEGNNIVMGRGDAANSARDWGVYLIGYGALSITGNSFDGQEGTVNASGGDGIFWNAESTAAIGGKATLSIVGNSFSVNCDYVENIVISNGAATDAGRRLKQLVVEGNTSLGQGQYFLKMSVTNTFYGVQDLKVVNNLINGAFNTLWNPASTNSRGIEVGGSEATDFCDVSKNVIRDKYYGIETNSHSGRIIADFNEFFGITSRWLGAVPLISDRRDNAPVDTAQDGSMYIRENGTTGNVLYMREAGAWVVVG